MDWPAPDWTSVEPFPFADARRAFAGPTSDPGRVVLRYYKRPDGRLAAVAAFGPGSEGAPGQVHGGILLTALDEALGAAAWVAGHPVLTARLSTEFRRGVPVGATLLVETEVRGARHRLVRVEGALVDGAGERYAAAKGDFMVLTPAQQEGLFGRAMGAGGGT